METRQAPLLSFLQSPPAIPSAPVRWEVFHTQALLEDAETNKDKQISLPHHTRKFNMLMCIVNLSKRHKLI